jgi:DNA-binding protein YbaB
MGPGGNVAGGRLGEYARLAERIRALRDGVDDIRATGFSRDGTVTAVVDGRGQLRDLELDPRIYRVQDSAALARSILDAVREAGEESRRMANRIALDLLPDRDRRGLDPTFDPALHFLERW